MQLNLFFNLNLEIKLNVDCQSRSELCPRGLPGSPGTRGEQGGFKEPIFI